MHPTQTVGVRSSPPTYASNNAPVLDAFRYDKPLPRAERDVPLAHLNSDATAQHQKKIIGVVVFVPNELAFHEKRSRCPTACGGEE